MIVKCEKLDLPEEWKSGWVSNPAYRATVIFINNQPVLIACSMSFGNMTRPTNWFACIACKKIFDYCYNQINTDHCFGAPGLNQKYIYAKTRREIIQKTKDIVKKNGFMIITGN